MNRKLFTAKKTRASLAELLPVPHIHDTTSLADICDQLQSAQKHLWKAETLTAALGNLLPLPATEKTTQLANITDQIIALSYRKKRLDRWHTVLQNIAEPPTIHSDDRLARLVADIRHLETQKGMTKDALTSLEKELEMVKDSLRTALDTLGCCPTCGADLNTEAFIDRGCRHDA